MTVLTALLRTSTDNREFGEIARREDDYPPIALVAIYRWVMRQTSIHFINSLELVGMVPTKESSRRKKCILERMNRGLVEQTVPQSVPDPKAPAIMASTVT